MREWMSGKKTIIGFIVAFAYAVVIQFFGAPSVEAIWGLIVAWTGVSFVVHVDKVTKNQ